MDDQFNGRTDDDLFADDFEPVAATEPVQQEQAQPKAAEPREPTPDAPASLDQNPAPEQTETQPPATTAAPPPPTAPRSLAQSRHNKPQSSNNHRQPRQNHQQNQQSQPAAASSAAAPAPATTTHPTTNGPPSAPAPREKSDPNARLGSGANPRTKLTEEELASKMEKMRILAAEKTKRFEQAERDERDHAIAYERGMEAARKRKAEEAEKRRRADEDRRRMDDERAKNRERKLKAMGMKEGGWDEGKEEREAEEDRRRGGYNFRGAHGGIRGSRGGGLAGSKFATAEDTEFFQSEPRPRGRGRGRGGPVRGRGGRGGFEGERNGDAKEDGVPRNGAKSAKAQAVPSSEEFPALPSSGEKKTAPATTSEPQPFSPLSPSTGKWDDEMAALDAKTE